MAKNIRYVFFDLGNVLLSFDHRKACQQMALLLGSDTDTVYDFLFASGLELQYENGLVTTAELIGYFEKKFGWRGELAALAHAASDIFMENHDTCQVVEELRGKIPIGILSNTSEIHFDYIKAKYPIVHRFEHWILSYEIKALKPHKAIFDIASEKVGCRPEECFFVDDIQANVDGAVAAGFDAVLYRGAEDLRQALRERGVLGRL